MSQTSKAIGLFEQVLGKVDFKQMVEIGTQSGNFSLYLYLFSLTKIAQFQTYDVKDQIDRTFVKDLLGFRNHFQELDVFKHIEEVAELLSRPGKTVLFCDGGDKEREFNTFVPFLKPGDIVAVHDWGTEVHKKNLNLDSVDELEPKLCEQEGMIRFFVKK